LYRQNPFPPLKTGLKWVKWPLKSGVLRAKSGLLSAKNNEPTTKLERQNGAKSRLYSRKIDKTIDVED